MFIGRKERRMSCRYRVTGAVFYFHDTGETAPGHGWLVDISSRGLLFESSGEFRPGMKLKLEIPWPAPSGQNSLLVVKIVGCVVRVDGKMTAVSIETTEFQLLAHKIAET